MNSIHFSLVMAGVLSASGVAAEEEADLSALPSMPAAERIIAEYNNNFHFVVDGRKTTAIPKPKFRFPAAGTPIRDTNLKIGDRLDLTGPLLSNDDFVLQDSAQGTATLIVFWSTDCSACLHEFPVEKAFYVKYKDRGFRIISVNGDVKRNRATRTSRKFGLPWPVVFDGDDGPIVKRLGVTAWPTLLLLDHERKIIHATYAGNRHLRGQSVSPPATVYQNELTMSLSKLFPDIEDKKAAVQ